MPTALRRLLGALLLAVILTARSAASHHEACTGKDKGEKAVCVRTQFCALAWCTKLSEQAACTLAKKDHLRCRTDCYECKPEHEAYKKAAAVCPAGSTLVFCSNSHHSTTEPTADSQPALVVNK